MRKCTQLFLLGLLFLSFNSAYSKRGPLSYFEKVATETDPKDPMRPARRIPKKSINIPEFKKIKAADKKRWDDVANQITKVVEELFKLELEQFKKPFFSKDKSQRLNFLRKEYRRLLKESEKLFGTFTKNK
jgi:hypothetical protein